MSDVRIFREREVSPVARGSGITSKPYAGAATGSTRLSNGITSLPPGTAVPLHTHNADESVVVLEGELVFQGSGRLETLHPFDGVLVPAGRPHCFRNESGAPGRILWTYASVEVTRTFAETGETVRHLSEGDRAF